VFEKGVDDREIDTVKCPFLDAGQKGQEKGDVGGIRSDTVLGQSSLGDEMMQIQLVSCSEMFGKEYGFDSASVGNQWPLLIGAPTGFLKVRPGSDF
jgi:hypothetical protein